MVDNRVTIRLPNPEVYAEFLEAIKGYYGRTHKCVGLELEKALKQRTRRLVLKKEGTKLDDLEIEEVPEIKKIFAELKLNFPNGGKTSKESLIKIVMKATGFSNHLTVKNKILMLEADHIVQELKNDKYLIFPDIIDGKKLVIEDVNQLEIPERFEEKIKSDLATAFALYDNSLEEGVRFRIGQKRYLVHTVEETVLANLEVSALNMLGYGDKYRFRRDWRASYKDREISDKDKVFLYIFEED